MATRFHSPVFMDDLRIHEVLDPVLPQDVATKSYVDNTKIDEVLIDAVQPRDASTELWVDLDDQGTSAMEQEVYVTALEPAPPWELWVAVGDAVPISGGPPIPIDEVFIQPAQPTAITADLWMDLSAPDPSDRIAALAREVDRLRADLDALRQGR